MKEQIRLDKYLAKMSVGSRSQVKQMIRKGQVCINGEIVKKAEQKVVIGKDTVSVDQKKVLFVPYEYYMMYKPAGVVCATKDKKDRTVLDLIQEKKNKDLFPAGRLDKDTEGLLLLTNDGLLAHQLLSPKKHVDKMYYAKIKGKVTKEDIDIFANGIDIGEKKKTLPAKLEILVSDDVSEIRITIQEGKFHQVKRMFEAVDKKVLYLKRMRFGPLVLDESLKPGQYRSLSKEEIQKLKGDTYE